MWRELCLAILLAACLAAANPYDIGGCGAGRRMCQGVKKCVPLSRVCDGRNDCGDNSDEQGCAGFTCPPNRFQCSGGRCIPGRWRCDDYDDCGDGSDEANCPAPPGRRPQATPATTYPWQQVIVQEPLHL